MRVEVVAFAALREALGVERFVVDVADGATGADLRARVAELHPRWRDLVLACRLASGTEFVADRAPLAEGAEMLFIPPVSGGSGAPPSDAPRVVRLTREPLDGSILMNAATHAAAGAVVVFEGTVRSPSSGRDVLHLEYEAHEPMALAQMERIVNEARERWPVIALFLHHRLGRVEVGEASVVAVASCPHRGEAFEACRHLIERLKADVPIWKKEFFADGGVWVGAPGACAHEDPR
jgi:molybdopterin synthase catalytic subunit/molybdopterin converting factor small subunit